MHRMLSEPSVQELMITTRLSDAGMEMKFPTEIENNTGG